MMGPFTRCGTYDSLVTDLPADSASGIASIALRHASGLDSSYNYVVAIDTPFIAGQRTARIHLHPIDATADARAALALRDTAGNVTVYRHDYHAPWLEPPSDPIDFGEAYPFQPKDSLVSVVNNGADTFAILGWQLDNGMEYSIIAGGDTLPRSVAPRETIHVAIRFRPDHLGTNYDQLSARFACVTRPIAMLTGMMGFIGTVVTDQSMPSENAIRVEPSPLASAGRISWSAPGVKRARIFDALGRIVLDRPLSPGERVLPLSPGDLTSAGSYLILIDGARGWGMQRFIVIR
jgi:hypothetical protein